MVSPPISWPRETRLPSPYKNQKLTMGLLGGATVVFAALRLASPVAAAALHFPTWPKPPTDSHVDAKNLTVDIAYGVYQGVHNSSTKLNVWKGYVVSFPLSLFYQN